MMNILFFGGLILYFVSVVLQFAGMAFKSKGLHRFAWFAFLAGFVLHSGYLVARGIIAGRLPMANQFEFATSFAWGVSLFYIVLRVKWRTDWLTAIALPTVFFMLSYAALLPREITDLMPALRSAWFGLHIGSAVLSYASFMLAGCAGVQYLLGLKKGKPESDAHMRQMDFMSYRLIALGMLMLTIVILSGALWAEQAWSSFWSWDPKELWSLITWIVYAIYLHQRLRKNWQGKRMAIFAIIAVGIVLFTFVGVNTLLPGLHSYR